MKDKIVLLDDATNQEFILKLKRLLKIFKKLRKLPDYQNATNGTWWGDAMDCMARFEKLIKNKKLKLNNSDAQWINLFEREERLFLNHPKK